MLKVKKYNDFEDLKKLLDSNEWPNAIDHQTTENIESFFLAEDLQGKNFLDFGCGEGHFVNYASQKSSFSAGYDLMPIEEKKENKIILTSNFENIKSNSPYDLILINDVLDHCDDPLDVLKKAKSILHENGKIYVRFHPWCSRHGGHIHKQLNKAFAHLVFSESELSSMGIRIDSTIKRKVIYPISTYEKLIKESGLSAIAVKIKNQQPEKFFSDELLVSKRIKSAMPEKNGTRIRQTFPFFQLQQSFLDFVLKK